MRDRKDLDTAMHAAVDPLTTEARRTFSDDMHARFPEAEAMVTSDPSAAMQRAWQLANCRLQDGRDEEVGPVDHALDERHAHLAHDWSELRHRARNHTRARTPRVSFNRHGPLGIEGAGRRGSGARGRA